MSIKNVIKSIIHYEKSGRKYFIVIPREELYSLSWIDGIADKDLEVMIEFNLEENTIKIINEKSKPMINIIHTIRKNKYAQLDGRRKLKNKSYFRGADAGEIAIGAMHKLAKGEPVRVNVRKKLKNREKWLKKILKSLELISTGKMSKDKRQEYKRLIKLLAGYDKPDKWKRWIKNKQKSKKIQELIKDLRERGIIK